MKNIQSNIIGELKQNEQFEDWWESESIEIPFFDNKELKITFSDFIPEEDKEFIKEADFAIETFLQKGKSERENISSLVYKNCMDYLNMVGYDEEHKEIWDLKDQKEIWKYVYPSEIFITRRPYKEQDVYVQICCECKWEEEHGLQIVFRKGMQVTRISEQDGHLTEADAYDKPDKEDELLSQFKK